MTILIEPAHAVPVNKKDRILFIDALRGFALIGIMFMNVMAQGQAHFFYDKMNLNQPITGPNFYTWIIEMGFLEGTMRGIFSVLFGAGAILLLERLEKNKSHTGAADIYYRRMFWLLLFGIINAFLFLWPGDILYSYAICGLFLFPFRKLSAKSLLLVAFVLLAIGTYKENSILYENKEIIEKGRRIELLQSRHQLLDEKQTADLEQWNQFRSKNNSEGFMKAALEEENLRIKVSGSYFDMVSVYSAWNVIGQSTLFYSTYWWDVLLFFFIGMALFKSGFLTGKSANWVYLLTAILGIGAGLTYNYFALKDIYTLRFDDVKLSENSLFSLYSLKRVFITLGYISLLIMLYKLKLFRRLFNVLIPIGKMAFTNYLSQSIIMGIIFYGFGLFGTLQRYQLYEVVIAVAIFQLIFSHIWLRYFMFGPFEYVWRSLTYMRLQPFKKTEENNMSEVKDKAVIDMLNFNKVNSIL